MNPLESTKITISITFANSCTLSFIKWLDSLQFWYLMSRYFIAGKSSKRAPRCWGCLMERVLFYFNLSTIFFFMVLRFVFNVLLFIFSHDEFNFELLFGSSITIQWRVKVRECEFIQVNLIKYGKPCKRLFAYIRWSIIFAIGMWQHSWIFLIHQDFLKEIPIHEYIDKCHSEAIDDFTCYCCRTETDIARIDNATSQILLVLWMIRCTNLWTWLLLSSCTFASFSGNIISELIHIHEAEIMALHFQNALTDGFSKS